MTWFIVGARYPLPYNKLMTASLISEDGPVRMLLQLALDDITVLEHRAVSAGRLRLGVVPSPPLAWITLGGDNLDFDAPFAIAREGAQASRIMEFCKSLGGEGANRFIVEIHCIEGRSGMLTQIRLLSISRAWMKAFANAVLLCPLELGDSVLESATRRDYARWPNVKTMSKHATAIETGGTV